MNTRKILVGTVAAVAAIGASLALAGPATAAGVNLVQNGDFEGGGLNSATQTALSSTDLTSVPNDVLGSPDTHSAGTPSMYEESTYTIGTSPGATHVWWADNALGDDPMMLINGSETKADQTLWKQTVDLGDQYTTTYKLVTGAKSTEIGTVTVRPDGLNTVSVNYNVTAPGYLINAVHVGTGATLSDLVNAKKANDLKIVPGQLDFNQAVTPPAAQVEVHNVPVVAGAKYIIAHADLTQTTPTGTVGQTATTKGKTTVDTNWFMYSDFTFEVPTYDFSMVATNVADADKFPYDDTLLKNANITVTLTDANGNIVKQATQELDTVGDVGRVVKFAENVTYSKTITIKVTNDTAEHSGNDFALDDISLVNH
jgi:hypothetical protein